VTSILIRFTDGTREFLYPSRELKEGDHVWHDGVRYRILPEREAGGRTPMVQVPYLMDSFLYDYGGRIAPRVAVVSKAEVIGDVGQQIERLFASGWDDRSTAIVEQATAAAGDAPRPLATPAPRQGRAWRGCPSCGLPPVRSRRR